MTMIEGQTRPIGPMGWGFDNLDERKLFDMELQAFEDLASVVPQRLMRCSAKPVLNTTLLESVMKFQRDGGFDAGFSFSALHTAITGHGRDWKAQLIGSCVASGDMRTTNDRMLAEIFLLNDPESLPGSNTTGTDNMAFFAPFSYRAGRREAGIGGNSDGSLCLPHIKGKMKYGHLPCSASGLVSDAFPEPQNMGTYRAWGANDVMLEKFAAEAGKVKLMESEPVSSTEDAKTLLRLHYKPMNICSAWAFKSTGKQIGKDAVGRPIFLWTRNRNDTWHHNMQVVGSLDANGKEYIEIGNSWAEFHNGNPNFLVSADEFDSWAKDAEIQSVGELDLQDNAPAFPA